MAGPKTPTPLVECNPRPVMIFNGIAAVAGVSMRIVFTIWMASETEAPCRSMVLPLSLSTLCELRENRLLYSARAHLTDRFD